MEHPPVSAGEASKQHQLVRVYMVVLLLMSLRLVERGTKSQLSSRISAEIADHPEGAKQPKPGGQLQGWFKSNVQLAHVMCLLPVGIALALLVVLAGVATVAHKMGTSKGKTKIIHVITSNSSCDGLQAAAAALQPTTSTSTACTGGSATLPAASAALIQHIASNQLFSTDNCSTPGLSSSSQGASEGAAVPHATASAVVVQVGLACFTCMLAFSLSE